MRDRLKLFLEDNSYLDVLNEEDWLLAADQLLVNGVIVPPCKVGDTVYTAFHPYKGNELRKPLEGRCITVGAYEFGNIVRVMFDTRKVNGCRDYRFTDFGKTVFLAKEEAEQALKGGEG